MNFDKGIMMFKIPVVRAHIRRDSYFYTCVYYSACRRGIFMNTPRADTLTGRFGVLQLDVGRLGSN